MRYQAARTAASVTVAPRAPVQGAVIWLHAGRGGTTSYPWSPNSFYPKNGGALCISARAVRPVTINNGYAMRAWYDIEDFSAMGRRLKRGMAESQAWCMDHRERIEAPA